MPEALQRPEISLECVLVAALDACAPQSTGFPASQGRVRLLICPVAPLLVSSRLYEARPQDRQHSSLAPPWYSVLAFRQLHIDISMRRTLRRLRGGSVRGIVLIYNTSM